MSSREDPATSPGSTFRIRALPAEDLEVIRQRGTDAFGNPVTIHVNTEEGGAPLRCCLNEAAVGERVALFAYRPFPFDGPYAECGPVYVHAGPCPGYTTPSSYPESLRHRTQVFRAYGRQERIVDAALVPGDHAEAVIADFFGRPDIAFLHSRNVLYGCYMFAIERDQP